MPPGQTIPANLSWTVAKKVLSNQDIERLACAFLNATSPVDFDAVKAGEEFGNVKPESFKRSIWVIAKKIKDHKGEADGEAMADAAKKSGGRGRKRKSDDEDDEEGGIAAKPVKKKGGRPKGKKAKAEMNDDAENDAVPGAERDVLLEEGDESDGYLM